MSQGLATQIAGSLALAGAVIAAPAAAGDAVVQGQEVFTRVCYECHNAVAPNPDMVAPPIFAAKNHYAGFAERADFVAAVSSYLMEPSEENARMPGAVRKFGLMPPPDVTEDEAVAVAEYLWATDFSLPDWYLVHFEEEHGEAPVSSN